MKVLVHRVRPGAPPAGVWWLPGNRTQPQHSYVDDSAYTDGAFAVLGDHWDGEPFSLAQWVNRAEALAGSGSPFYVFSVHDTNGDPRDFLLSDAADAA